MDMLQIIHTALKKENFEYVVEDGTHNDTWYVGGLNYFKVLNEFLNHAARLRFNLFLYMQFKLIIIIKSIAK